ncbi:UDP-N-acetylglucosamine 1-carboxyvinyltransferase [Thermosporothrix hazakensis]|jgi:UDP-N-acetylglucosamine 1-carboxyvinyltransferase|uniref:UDP-N-acetylglucosamine 1-carboxyvinyltransferase n=2 Tax=Thermosporothrix TaxID=768650 RepID=A0A326UFA5_THEHA|nr:UDP-N-acetylglucosamine 1-carboxyvinyltransferase [Thermosporothrix hazakensis]PZW36551.1 UDP-N-acetylglucosamine 1-carboxyvinyltransferase [Thermosporothrix hazakensis]BBH89017.1 UDP-N-acetylglucosamine 1-carboxyvinyltransferase [Thermosporothrix sp. COM3]GCE47201.1 UDP-N-acetylglucosamine 1-carboxyvinyltransferase [Thermosporothrix hazakensis]
MELTTASSQRGPYYRITGGTALEGEVVISGAKNAVTKMIIASLLTDEQCILRNVPLLGDMYLTMKLCEDIGSELSLEDHTLSIRTPDVQKTVISTEVGGLNRIAVLTLGPLLHRRGEVTIPAPGGDRIGPRPIDFHINGLRQMGAVIIEKDGHYFCSAPNGLRGTTIKLPFPSVMATENFLISASLARGVTIIENAATEPEIIDLIKLLQKMGAIIEIKVDRRIVIEGVERLHGAVHTLLSDRNEAVSLAIAAYLTRGDVYLRRAQQDTLLTFLNTLSKMGLRFEVDDEGIRFIGRETPPPAIALETDVHPGFMTDWQQPFTVLLTQAKGMSVVHETIYEDRFGYTEALIGMGAQIGLFTKCLGEVPCRFRSKEHRHSCVINGPTPLKGTRLLIPDIRAGCSYILAALCAEGVSEVYGIEHIERGYEHLDWKLRQLGAQIERIAPED